MRKIIGSTCLVAGTCIGGGMIALPMVLAKFGLILSAMLTIIIWLAMHYTSLVNLELNLQAKKGLPLGALARLYDGKVSELIGLISLKLLSYSLLSAYLYGGTSILKNLLLAITGQDYDFMLILYIHAAILSLIIILKIQWVDYINRILFIGLLLILGLVIASMAMQLDFSDMPLMATKHLDMPSWTVVIPIVFTSFGFQVIFHTLTNYCNKDALILKRAFFWGSLIPTIVYMIWTICTLALLYYHKPTFYNKIVTSSVEAGELIEVLSQVNNWPYIKSLSWVISILAIVTSAIGVGLGLIDTWKQQLKSKLSTRWNINNAIPICLTILPPLVIAAIVPNAFIQALSFAGMILTVIAIFLPVYLLYKAKSKTNFYFYPILKNTFLRILIVALGIVVICCEIIHLV